MNKMVHLEVNMKSITIHGIDAELDKKIAEKAAEIGLSQNRTVKFILKGSLIQDKKAARKESFSELFGKWSEKEKEEFNNNIIDLEEINESDWEK